MDQSGSILKNYLQDIKAFQNSDASKEVFSLIDQIGDAFRDELKVAQKQDVNKKQAKAKPERKESEKADLDEKQEKQAVAKKDEEKQADKVREKEEVTEKAKTKEKEPQEKIETEEHTKAENEEIPTEKKLSEGKAEVKEEALPVEKAEEASEEIPAEETEIIEENAPVAKEEVISEEKPLVSDGEKEVQEIPSETSENLPAEAAPMQKQGEVKAEAKQGDELKAASEKAETAKTLPTEKLSGEKTEAAPKEVTVEAKELPAKAKPEETILGKVPEQAKEAVEKALAQGAKVKVSKEMEEQTPVQEPLPSKEEIKVLAKEVIASLDKQTVAKVTDAIQNLTQTAAAVQAPLIEAIPPHFVKALEEMGSEMAKELKPKSLQGDNLPLLGKPAKIVEGSERKAVKFTEAMKTYNDPKLENLKSNVVNQVKIQLKAAIEENKGEVQMRLRPHLLGDVQIKLSIEEHSVRATFIVENNTAKEMLLKGAADLQESLEEKGIRAEEIAVEVREDSSQNFHNQGKAFASHEDEKASRELLQAIHTLGSIGKDSETVAEESKEDEDSDSLINIIA